MQDNFRSLSLRTRQIIATLTGIVIMYAGIGAGSRNADAATTNGLSGAYFTNETFAGTPALTRIDPTVDFNWGQGSPAFP